MDNVVKEIMQRTEQALGYPDSMAIVLTQHGVNDWEVYFPDSDGSMRGNRQDAIKEISELMEYADSKGGNQMSTAELVESIKYEFDNAMPDDDTKLDFEGIINICKRLGTQMDTQINVSQAIDAARIVLSDYERVQRGIIPHW